MCILLFLCILNLSHCGETHALALWIHNIGYNFKVENNRGIKSKLLITFNIQNYVNSAQPLRM